MGEHLLRHDPARGLDPGQHRRRRLDRRAPLPVPLLRGHLRRHDGRHERVDPAQLEHGATYSATEESLPIPYAGDDNGLLALVVRPRPRLRLGAHAGLGDRAPARLHRRVAWRGARRQLRRGHLPGDPLRVHRRDRLPLPGHRLRRRRDHHGADATVGVECPNGVHAVQLSYHQPSLTDGLAVAFTPTAISVGALSPTTSRPERRRRGRSRCPSRRCGAGYRGLPGVAADQAEVSPLSKPSEDRVARRRDPEDQVSDGAGVVTQSRGCRRRRHPPTSKLPSAPTSGARGPR